MNTERDRIISEAFSEYEDAVEGRALDSDLANPDREFICGYVIRNAHDPAVQSLWAAYVDRFGLAGDN